MIKQWQSFCLNNKTIYQAFPPEDTALSYSSKEQRRSNDEFFQHTCGQQMKEFVVKCCRNIFKQSIWKEVRQILERAWIDIQLQGEIHYSPTAIPSTKHASRLGTVEEWEIQANTCFQNMSCEILCTNCTHKLCEGTGYDDVYITMMGGWYM